MGKSLSHSFPGTSVLLMGISIFISRVTGLARELFIAYIFGVSPSSDAVNVAFKFPMLFRKIFGEGGLSPAFVPIYSHKLHTNKIGATSFASNIFIILLIAMLGLVITLILLMPYIIYFIAPGFYTDYSKLHLSITLCRITIIYLIFISIGALCGSMLNSIGRYIVFALAPVILNCSLIVFTKLFSNFISPALSISYSIVIGGLFQLFFIYYFNIKHNIRVHLTKPNINADSKKFIKKLLPSILSSGIGQINLFISQSIASFFPGAISILAYADRIFQLPISLIGVTISTMLLTELSVTYAKKNLDRFFSKQNDAIFLSSLLAIPCSFGIMSLSQEIIFTIYERGEFVKEDMISTARILYIYSLALPAFVYSKILMQTFYSSGDTKTPMKISLCSLVVNIVCTLIFIYFLGFTGLAVATSISSWLIIFLQIFYLKKFKLLLIDNKTYCYIAKSVLISAMMFIFLFIMKTLPIFNVYTASTALIKIPILGFLILAGIGFYALICIFFGIHHKMQNILGIAL